MATRKKRELKLTPKLRERLCTLLRAGNYVETAAKCCAIHKDTFYDWMKRGGSGEEPYASFADDIHQAMAESEARDIAIIGAAAKAQWQAAAWRLERRFPDKYGRHDRTRIEGKVDVEVGDDKLANKLARLIAGAAGDPGDKERAPGE